VEIFSNNFNVITIPQLHGGTDGETDGQTTCRGNTALCSIRSPSKNDTINPISTLGLYYEHRLLLFPLDLRSS